MMKGKLFAILLSSFVKLAIFEYVSPDFYNTQVVPDVFAVAPREILNVQFGENLKVVLNRTLTPAQAKNPPSLNFTNEEGSFYSMIMLDPDVPSRLVPVARSFLHWFVVNVPGRDPNDGDILAEYISPAPPILTGLHRYVLAVYKQPGKLKFKERKLTVLERVGFSMSNFAEKYDLGNPKAGNMFQAQFDSYVPLVYARLILGLL